MPLGLRKHCPKDPGFGSGFNMAMDFVGQQASKQAERQKGHIVSSLALVTRLCSWTQSFIGCLMLFETLLTSKVAFAWPTSCHAMVGD